MADKDWPSKRVTLSPPNLPALAASISTGLANNFVESSCEIETPPDLTLPPYHLAGSGLSGSTRIVDVGGPPYLQPKPDLSKRYDLQSVARQIDLPSSGGFLLGAGAGPFHVLGQNSELMPNYAYGNAAGASSEAVRNRTHFAKITASDDVACCALPNSTGFGLMCNLFGSEGLSGPCLHVTAKSRTGPLNFTEAIQKGLSSAFGDKLVSIGGVFLIKSGKANLHVMPDFPSQPFESREDVEKWLRFFDMEFGDKSAPEGPLVCLSVLHSGDDSELNLRMEHTHCFTVNESGDGERETTKGGHYHYDLDETRDVVEYEGWYNVAEVLYRIDQPGG